MSELQELVMDREAGILQFIGSQYLDPIHRVSRELYTVRHMMGLA